VCKEKTKLSRLHGITSYMTNLSSLSLYDIKHNTIFTAFYLIRNPVPFAQ